MHICGSHVYNECEEQKKMLSPLGLELEMMVSHHVSSNLSPF